jgi:hypothetical protein
MEINIRVGYPHRTAMRNYLHVASTILLVHAACFVLQAQDNSSNTPAQVVIAAPSSENERLVRGVHVRNAPEKFGEHTLNCAVIEHGPETISNSTQYCFEPGGSQLRYVRGAG